MARLRRLDPEDADFFASNAQSQRAGLQTTSSSSSKPAIRSSSRKKATNTYREEVELSDSDSTKECELQLKSTPKAVQVCGKQRRLAPLQAASLSKPLQIQPLLLPNNEQDRLAPRRCDRTLFARKPSSPVKKAASTPPLSDSSDAEETVEVEVEESVWCGSDASIESDEEDILPSPRKFLSFAGKPRAERPAGKAAGLHGDLDLVQRLQDVRLDAESSDALPKKSTHLPVGDVPKDFSRPGTSSDKENNDAILRFSPPRLHSPRKNLPSRPVTPPQSPSKQRLQSPTKTKARVPSPKIRQSLDAFWNAETVNEWNDQYSPRKTLKSPRKPLRPAYDGDDDSPTTSPRKPAQNPAKRDKAAREAKQAFKDSKHRLAETFLADLDDTITNGQIRALAASTGGVRFIWSRTLNSTAGRANWRRETSKIRTLDSTSSTETMVKHHASIELAEKVIDNEHRLLNVLAHEFCHLANFMVSGIKDQPHGKQFRAWGSQVTKAFGDRGVEVTTKHSYEIEYRYIWRCSGEACGSEFKRHSKSIDPRRHTCGSCRSKLVQVKPTPRSGTTMTTADGSFAAFVKLHFTATKAALPPGAPQKAVMEALGAKFRAEKLARSQASRRVGVPEAEAKEPTGEGGRDDGVERLAEGVEVISLVD